ncbi:MAG: tetratricopeptide repeat protein [Limnoraphis robusta]|uniref:tetratricopeptide repeat protein n=1 Tax=Limnoraphis robusta TaxID=1118279 RepID=UPI002B201E1C|nr:tetratricopeptide repeat protein [Limnoraphis robusta]MEA5541299.1 tetratricopeptide repeat protein [Limnoraphis robusta Tam1]
MGYSIEVNSDNFEREVLQKSEEQIILVDFFATWCGPCQLMKPLLEKLVEEYDFILAKVDIDKNPDLANTYNVEGVPDVRIVQQGEVLPGFVGALNEVQLRQLLGQLNFKSEVDQEFAKIKTAIVNRDLDLAQNLFKQLLKKYPNQPDLTLQAALFFIEMKQSDEATQLLATISEDQREYYPKAQALKQLIEFQAVVQQPGTTELDQLYAQACRFTLEKNYPQALKTFLEVVKIDRSYKNDGARKAMLSLFELLGDDHSLTKEYRKQLMLQLY